MKKLIINSVCICLFFLSCENEINIKLIDENIPIYSALKDKILHDYKVFNEDYNVIYRKINGDCCNEKYLSLLKNDVKVEFLDVKMTNDGAVYFLLKKDKCIYLKEYYLIYDPYSGIGGFELEAGDNKISIEKDFGSFWTLLSVEYSW